MRGLTIVAAEPAAARLRTALTMALAQAALGGRARLFLDAGAVAAVRAPIVAPDDAAQRSAGLPTLHDLLDEALAAGVQLILCQSGLALAGTTMADHDVRIEAGGMVSIMQTLGEDRLVVV